MGPLWAEWLTLFIGDLTIQIMKRGKSFIAGGLLFSIAGVVFFAVPVAYRHSVRNSNERTITIMRDLAIDVEAVRLRLGAAPTNEAQLVQLLGRPLPRSGWDELIKYENVDGNFRIQTFSPYPWWEVFEYNSLHPTSGVQRFSF